MNIKGLIEHTLNSQVDALTDAFTIGTASTFCDESDFDHASYEEIKNKLRPALQKLVLNLMSGK